MQSSYTYKGYTVDLDIYDADNGRWGVTAEVKKFSGDTRGLKCNGACGSSDARKFKIKLLANKDMKENSSNLNDLMATARRQIERNLDRHLREKHKPKK
jgi:hypothetical protein